MFLMGFIQWTNRGGKFMNKNIIASWIDSHEAELIESANYLHAHPELAYKEYLACEYLGKFLERHGFEVTYKTADIDTAFEAVWRSNGASEDVKPILGFLAEYDALAEIGHACGHNLLGTGVCAAACAMKTDMEKIGLFFARPSYKLFMKGTLCDD